MKLIKIILGFSLFFTWQNTTAQEVVIAGKVTAASTGKPISGADVFIQGTSVSTNTNKDGDYQLSGLQQGKTYAIAVFSSGLKSQIKQLTPQQNKIELNFQLEEFEEILDEVTITESKDKTSGISRLKSVEGTAIYEAKKSEVIVLSDVTANLATNNSRQVYNKVPGLNIWESDGAGIQLGIGGRGLSPNRTSNFNTRQNGYDIAADALGYPESYYTPPLEAVEKIQIVRGAASLQYGTQFGGMLNFVMKKGNPDKKIELVSRQTIGSFGLFNSFNSVGGKVGKMDYYGFYQYKTGNGWRPNSGFEVNTMFTDFNFQLTDKLFLCFEFTHMDYLAQQPGGLTHAQFKNDPRQSTRERNWFKVDWNIGAILFEYKFTNRTKLEIKNFGLYASRDALGELGRVDRPDPMQERLLIKDNFRNVGSEARVMHHYSIEGRPSVLLVGSRYYRGFDDKMQGMANAGREASFNYLNADSLRSNHDFYIENLALFAENIFNITDKFSVTPGVRYEWIGTTAEGYYQKEIDVLDENGLFTKATIDVPDSLESYRPVVLGGIGLSYKHTTSLEFYGNVSRNFRAITFSDLRTINDNMQVDPNMKDEKGYSADLGMRGNNRNLNFDVSLFYLNYDNKIGNHLTTLNGRLVRITSNISNANIVGLEAFAETDLFKAFSKSSKSNLILFTNLALIRGRYGKSLEAGYSYKKVELVPDVNLKTGLNFKKGDFSTSWQFTYVNKQYSDATNTNNPLPSAIDGVLPAYYISDLSCSYKYKIFTIESGVNNLTNNMYFTRRATGYPGPGIIPSDGRSFYLTLQLKL